MTLFKWVIKNLVHYWRMHLAVTLAAATATATLTGALFVGDSVKATLKYSFDARLGNISWAVSASERFFTEELSERLKRENIHASPVLQLRGMVTKGDGSIRVNQVRVLGVDDRFFKMSLAKTSPQEIGHGNVLVNNALASRLRLSKESNPEVVLRFDNPSAISRNLVLAPNKNSTISMRLPVTGVVDDNHFGRFSLEANQQEPFNLFVPLTWLQNQIDRQKKVNLLIINDPSGKISTENLNQAINRQWSLADASISLEADRSGSLELKSSRVFIDHSIASAALKVQPDASALLTYFVNELRVENNLTPYSMVTAADRKGDFAGIFPRDMKDDQIVINQWLANDLNAVEGDLLTIKYFFPGEWQTLQETQKSFTICRVIPIEGAAADPGLMPDLPGLSDSENCSEWDPSLPIDLDRIRDKDEIYWDNHRGTPKAFVTLAAGQSMWENTYGNLTSVRFQNQSSERDDLAEKLLKNMNPASFGLSALPVRDAGMQASKGGTDFGQLFLGLSMFLIFSGILLTWLLFVFGIEGRKNQTGMLLAIGFPAKQIRKLYVIEGLLIAFLGALAGSLAALVYTKVIVWGLSNAWQGAVAGMTVLYSATPGSLVTGFLSGFLIALIAMNRALGKQIKATAHSLLSGSDVSDRSSSTFKKRKTGLIISIIFFCTAMLLVTVSNSLGSGAMAGAFFGAGTLLLISIMIWIRMALIRLDSRNKSSLNSLNSLALRNNSRRRGRSMAAIIMLACGVFMVVAVGANRKDHGVGAEKASSGTGGFSLYAESSVPVIKDLNSESGRDNWGLDPELLEGTEFINLKVRKGDDASCLNLNRTQEPQVLGVSTNALIEREAFSFRGLKENKYKEQPWKILEQDSGKNIVPAVGDYPTVYWGLGKNIGDSLVYQNRKGQKIELLIVGMINSSILQGSLLISGKAMSKYFPEVEGYNAWLIDTPPGRKEDVSEHLTRRLADSGFSVETTVKRLELFGRMEDTYLSIFLILGGLGLILGCIGLGLIVARNLLERQGEIAMMRAVGFSKSSIIKLVCLEHVYLLIAGITAGFICALVSVMPSIRSAGEQLPFGLIMFMMLMIAVSGFAWVVISTRITLQGNILTPLRNE